VKVILITYRYAPEDSPNALRWRLVAEHWVTEGYEVDVVCSFKPGLAQYEEIGGVRVHRVGGRLVERLRRHLRGPAVMNMAGAGEDSSRRVRMTISLKWLHDHTWKKVYWPDYACTWYLPATRKVSELLDSGRYEGMVSVSHPFTAHLVALRAKARYLRVSWTVDMGDPFSFVEDTPANNRRLYGALNYRIERRVFEVADAVAVTPQAAEKYAGEFPESAEKMRPVPLPLPQVERGEREDRVFPADGKLRLVFIGTLYRSIRRPDFLLRLFAELLQKRPGLRPELHFFGNVEECRESFEPYRELLGSNIFLHGVVNHSEALRAVEESDVVVNIANNTLYQLPSKVMEYAAAGKPVLNIASIEDDSSAKFFDSYPAALNIVARGETPREEQLETLIRFLDDLPGMEAQELRQWLTPYQLESVAGDYEELLRRGTDKRAVDAGRRPAL
jgi:glycosyltransferase involved in cell wall biosynthesis